MAVLQKGKSNPELVNQYQWSNGLVVTVLDSQSRVRCSKPLGGSKVDSAFHPSKFNTMSTRNFWELSGQSGSSLEAVEPHP